MARLVRVRETLTESEIESLRGVSLCFHTAPEHPSFAHAQRIGLPLRPLLEGDSCPEEAVLIVPIWEPRPGHRFEELVRVVDRLLAPGGCPWDREQTHETLKRHLLEETYEVLDAVDRRSDPDLEEELGDLILQPVMHAQIASAAGRFDIDAVVQGILDKLVRRHPHVFGEIEAEDTETVLRNWDAIKRAEKSAAEPTSLLAGIPVALPALLRAYEVSKRAARAGFEWPDLSAVFEKTEEELAELREAIASGDPEAIEAELGDLLFTWVNVARWLRVEPEDALRKMLARFTARFQSMERLSPKPLLELAPQEWEALWQQAKVASRTTS